MKRRHFLRRASLAAASVAPARALGLHQSQFGRTPVTPEERPDVELHALLARAVDAATDAGATYADAHLTLGRRQSPGWSEGEDRAIGVRALVNGYWGFLASSVWTADESVRLARGAVTQAEAHSRGRVREVELGPPSTVKHGEWIMPVKYDPFDIPVVEKFDVMNAFADYASSYQVGIGAHTDMRFFREKRLAATSDGASWSQTRYQSEASFVVTYRDEYHARLGTGAAGADGLGASGRGWELVADSGLIDTIPRWIAEAEESRHRAPLDVGRYDIEFSAEARATVLDQTLGAATELDRALGYEANASGTSFLNDPLAMLGTPVIGNPLITVTANRSIPHGLATVKWDDEGIVPDDFMLIKDGVLIDYQTTREQAAWLAPYYKKIGRAIRSHGCANAASAMSIPMQHSPNLALAPSPHDVSFDDLVAGTEKGIAMLSLNLSMDQQVLNGMGFGVMREIKKGKLGRFIDGGALVFRAPELWKNVIGLGGARTFDWYPASRGKGQPGQGTSHTVGAVPAKIKQLSIVDPVRKA